MGPHVEELFSKNLALWKTVNPGWGAVLEQIICKFVFFHDNPDGTRNLTVDIDGKRHFFYSSENNPKERVGKIDLKSSHVVFIYGIGLGYDYTALQDWLHADLRHRLVFLEDNLEVIHRFFETDLATTLLNDKQVRLEVISWPWTLQDDSFVQNAIAYCYDPYTIAALDFYTHVRQDRFSKLKDLLAYALWIYRKTFTEIFRSNTLFLPNFFTNIFFLPSSYRANLLQGQFSGVPAIICGAGPSIGKNIDVLKTLSDRALIFGPGTAMNALNSLGLIPHFGVGIDPNTAQFERMMANNAFEVPFFYRNRMNPDALQLVQADRIWISGAGGYEFPKWFEKQLGIESESTIEEGYNVINFSLSIAEKLGCNPIILVGVDLAYTDNQSYAPHLKEFVLSHEANAFVTKSREEELIVQNDIFGKPVYTLWKWKNESDWIGSFAHNHPRLKIINSTEGGIGFPGIQNEPLAKVADEYLNGRYDFLSKIHGEIQNSRMPPEVTEENILKCLEEFKDSLERCQKTYQEGDLPQEEIAETLLLAYVGYAFDHFYRIRMKLQNPGEIKEEEMIKEKRLFLGRYAKEALRSMDFSNRIPLKVPCERKEERQSLESLLEGSFGEKNQTFYADGALKELSFTRNGKRNGPSLYFGREGNLLSFSRYENGLREGLSLFYYADGRLKAERLFQKGLPEGKHEYFYATGTVRTILPYIDGKLDGEAILFFPDGKRKRTLCFKQGMRHGLERLWNPQGQLIFEAEYVEDRPVGTVSGWYQDGQLRIRVHYDREGVEQEVEEWDRQGRKISKARDYFDQLIEMTNTLAGTIDQCSIGIEALLIKDESFSQIKEELLKLKEANQKIQQAFGKESFKEPIWKTDAFQKQIRHQIGGMIEKMAEEIRMISQAIEEANRNQP